MMISTSTNVFVDVRNAIYFKYMGVFHNIASKEFYNVCSLGYIIDFKVLFSVMWRFVATGFYISSRYR